MTQPPPGMKHFVSNLRSIKEDIKKDFQDEEAKLIVIGLYFTADDRKIADSLEETKR